MRQLCEGARAWLCRRAVKQLLASGDTLRLNFPRFDLGVAYTPHAPTTVAQAQQHVAQWDRGKPFHQALRVGARLPHAWLQVAAGSAEAGTRTVSSTDLMGLWPGRALLLAAPQALAQIAQCFDASAVQCVLLALHRTPKNGGSKDETPHQPSEQDSTPGGEKSTLIAHAWPAGVGGPPGGSHELFSRRVNSEVVLVRPDGHVAWLGSLGDARRRHPGGLHLRHLLCY